MAKMISRETMTVGIVAVVMGLAAAYGVRMYMTPGEEGPPPPEKPAPPMITVPLAGEDLPADRVITSGDIALVKMTRTQFDKRFKGINAEEVMTSARNIVGRRMKEPLKQGQPFLTTKLYLEGTYPNIAGKLQPGYRAVRIQVPQCARPGCWRACAWT